MYKNVLEEEHCQTPKTNALDLVSDNQNQKWNQYILLTFSSNPELESKSETN